MYLLMGISVAVMGVVLVMVFGSWGIILWHKGVRGLLGYDNVVVQTFEAAVVYSKGRFSQVLTVGDHWIRAKSAQVIRVDLRPETWSGEQWVTSGDGVSTFVRWSARVRVEDARKLVENTKNYGSDVFCRIQSCVKAAGTGLPYKTLQGTIGDPQDAVISAISASLAEIGCSCLGFEFLDVRPAIDMQEPREIGFINH